MASKARVQTADTRVALDRVTEPWNPRILAELNGQHVKVARLEGAFVWHAHEHEDELFHVLSGVLRLEMRDERGERSVTLEPGQFAVVPRGLEHRPVADPVAEVLLFEPAGTVNTGAEDHALRRDRLDWITDSGPKAERT